MIEIPMFVWVCVSLYILIACAKQILAIGVIAEMLNDISIKMDKKEKDNE
jgi:hypothetical protein